MVELKHLKVFTEVAERGSFSAAAEALNYTQPAVSQQIAALERATGAKLVDRMPRGIRLTDAGRTPRPCSRVWPTRRRSSSRSAQCDPVGFAWRRFPPAARR